MKSHNKTGAIKQLFCLDFEIFNHFSPAEWKIYFHHDALICSNDFMAVCILRISFFDRFCRRFTSEFTHSPKLSSSLNNSLRSMLGLANEKLPNVRGVATELAHKNAMHSKNCTQVALISEIISMLMLVQRTVKNEGHYT